VDGGALHLVYDVADPILSPTTSLLGSQSYVIIIYPDTKKRTFNGLTKILLAQSSTANLSPNPALEIFDLLSVDLNGLIQLDGDFSRRDADCPSAISFSTIARLISFNNWT
jgi:hypothetical protein